MARIIFLKGQVWFFTFWCVHSNIVCVNSSIHEKHASSPRTMLGKDLLFWYIQIDQLEKFNLFWYSFSVNCCLTWIRYEYHLISFQVIPLNNDTDKPSPFRHVLACGLFCHNSQTLSIFYSVTEDRPLPEFSLLLFRFVPKFQYFATLHWMVLLQGASQLNCKLSCCRTWLILLLLIYFSTTFVLQSLIKAFSSSTD